MLGPSGLGALARVQLAAWQQIAMSWPVQVEQHHLRCRECKGQILTIADKDGFLYTLTPQHVLDATVMHLRQCHEDLDPDR